MSRLYFLFRFHNYKISDFAKMPYGEKMLTLAFARYEIDERNKEIEAEQEHWKEEESNEC